MANLQSTEQQLFTGKIAPDYLDSIALSHLELLLKIFHVPIRNISCKAEYLEELFYTALKHRYPDANIQWNAGSHSVGTDITLDEAGSDGRTYQFSIKSGRERTAKGTDTSFIDVSGSRLQSKLGVTSEGLPAARIWESSGQSLVDWLNNHHKDFIVLMAPSVKEDGVITYEIRYVSPELFSYPDASAWVQKGAELRATLASGIEVSLRPTMSWQIWWKIPKEATRLIKRISILV